MKVLVFVLFVMGTTYSRAQDPHFSQFYANPVYLNPAFVGTADGNRVIVNHRQQWSNPISYTTSAISVDGKFNFVQSGWSIQIMNDNQINGLLLQTKISTSFAHRIKLSKDKYLGMGLGIGVYQKKFDWSDLVFEDQIDDRYGVVNPTNERFGRSKIANADVNIGFLYYSKNLFAGVTVNHTNRPKEDFTISSENRLAMRYSVHAGGILPLYEPGIEQYVSPSIVLEQQGSMRYVNLGLHYSRESIVLGMYYRVNDAIIGLLGINYQSFKFGYSYDFTISDVATGNNNSHELSLAYLFEFPKSYNRKGRYRGKCPKFYKYLL